MQVVGKVAALMNVQENQVVVDSMKTSFGMTSCTGTARIYDSVERRDQIERAFLISRGVPKPKGEEA